MDKKRKYKILHIVSSLESGGTEKWLVKLIKHWDNTRFEASVISFKDGVLRSELLNLGIEPIIVEKPKGHHLRFIRKLYTEFKRLKPDIIHCRNSEPVIIYGGIACKIAHLPLVVSIHGHNHFIKRKPVEFRIICWILNRSSKIIAVSKSIKESLINQGKIHPDKIDVIHNGIDIKQIKYTQKDNKKREFNLNGSEIILGCVGNLRSVKGHRYLIQSMPMILKSAPDVRLMMVGDGPLRNELETLAGELKVKDKITFLGYRSDIYEIMPIFDIFILPSLSEGLCNAVIEAMAAKLPVIATNTGGNPELVEDGKTGILIPPRSPENIANAVLELVNDANKRNDMGESGFNKVKNEFQLNRTIKKYEDAYISLIKR